MDADVALTALTDRMRREGLPEELVTSFSRAYGRFRSGETGKVPWPEILPPTPDDIVDRGAVQAVEDEEARPLLDQLVCIRLNGGLGTSMKLSRAKSLIPVRGGRNFLELTAEQVLRLRRSSGARLPLLLMNSFKTRADSLACLSGFTQPDGLPVDFLQHKYPRIDANTGGPAEFFDTEGGWAPPGHGDIYLALLLGGLLDRLLEAGYRWAFVANIDNLAATVDVETLAYLARHEIEFAMEVTAKSLADVKGGTLVRRGGRLTLLERAQVEPEHLPDFEDIQTFEVFNTNSLWWHLPAVKRRLDEGRLELPLILNPKQEQGVAVVQLETAMGAAVGCFDRALGILVPRRRFAPVKTTDDLLAVRSDAFVLDDEGALRLVDSRTSPPVVSLDRSFYTGIEDFEGRVPEPVSLLECGSLKVEGDVRFGDKVTFTGDVTLRNRTAKPVRIPDGRRFDTGVEDLGFG